MDRDLNLRALLARSRALGLTQSQRRALRRASLRVLLASLAISALMGIAGVLGGDFGDTQAKLLFTAIGTFGVSAIVLSCGLAWERNHLGMVPPAGIVCGLVGFVVVVYAIWWQPDFDNDFWLKAYFTEIMVAVAATHASLVSVSGVLRRFRWAVYMAYGLNLLAIFLTLLAIWSEIGEDGFWKFYGIVIVLLIAVTIAVPILRRLEDAPDDASPPKRETLAARFCPSCGVRLRLLGDVSCTACGVQFQVFVKVPSPTEAQSTTSGNDESAAYSDIEAS